MQNPTNNNPAGLQIHANSQSVLLKIEALLSTYKNLPGHALLDGPHRAAVTQGLDRLTHISFLFAGVVAIATLFPHTTQAAALAPAAQHRVLYREDTRMASHPEIRVLITPVFRAEPATPQPALYNF